MSDKQKELMVDGNEEVKENTSENTVEVQTSENISKEIISDEESSKSHNGFRFFKSASASLKRFSVLIFAINIFFIVITAALSVILIAFNFGWNMLSLLAVPILTAAIVLVFLSRFFSALIYGFAEIVEKFEK